MTDELFTSFEAQIDRLKKATGVTTDTALAKSLGLGQGSVSNARLRKTIPAKWFIKISNTFNINNEWLISGTGPMHRDERQEPSTIVQINEAMERIKELEAQLAQKELELIKAREEALNASREATTAYKKLVEVLRPETHVLSEPVVPTEGGDKAIPASQNKENHV